MALTAAQATAAAQTAVDRYAPDAPDDIKAAAVDRLATWIGTVARAAGETSVQYGSQKTDSAPVRPGMRESGAGELLAPWRRPRARVIEEAAS